MATLNLSNYAHVEVDTLIYALEQYQKNQNYGRDITIDAWIKVFKLKRVEMDIEHQQSKLKPQI